MVWSVKEVLATFKTIYSPASLNDGDTLLEMRR
jgi:hypothetical protein